MPVYAYKCPECHAAFDVVKKVVDLDRPEVCGCGGTAQRQICLPMVFADYPGYESPAHPGKWVEGKRAHIEDLKRSGCRLLEPGESKEYIKNGAAKRRQANEKLLDQAVESAARDLGMGR